MERSLPQKIVKWLEKYIYHYPNVTGFSRTFKKKIVQGKETDIDCIRIYVVKKVPKAQLLDEEIIPIKIKGITTDVIEVGKVEALQEKTDMIRPVKMGISVGHRHITAGSIGFLFKHNEEIYVGSNAHVLTPNPSWHPRRILEKRILQPAPYHLKQKGLDLDDPQYVVGQYYWHERVWPIRQQSECSTALIITKLYNKIAELLKRETRLVPIIEKVNHIDFAVYEPTEEHIPDFIDINIEEAKFIGLLFAGSKYIGVICKAKYIAEKGYTPIEHEIYEPELFNRVYGSSFWCNYKTKVIDESAEIEVWYGDWKAKFTDIIIVDNEEIIRGGWSGSAWWWREEQG